MRYRVSLNFEGSVKMERGPEDRRRVSFRGSGGPPESTDQWQMATQLAWAHGPAGQSPTGGIAVTGPMGGTLQASLQRGTDSTFTDEEGRAEAWMVNLVFTVRKSTERFAGAAGTIRLSGVVRRQGFFLTADLDLNAPETAWLPPNSGLLSEAETASGASHIGAQPLAQEDAERKAEAQLIRADGG